MAGPEALALGISLSFKVKYSFFEGYYRAGICPMGDSRRRFVSCALHHKVGDGAANLGIAEAGHATT